MLHKSGFLTTMTMVFLALACTPARAQVTFQEIPVPNLWILSMSADGRVGVGISAGNQPGNVVDGFRWTPEGGVENIGGYHAFGIIVSRDGKTIVGHVLDSGGNSEMAIWQGGKNWMPLGGIHGQGPDTGAHVLSVATGVSADGSVIVGQATLSSSKTHAVRWDAQNGMVDLGALFGESSQALAISADANTIVGWDFNRNTNFPLDHRQGVVFWNGLERPLHAFGWAGSAKTTNFNGAIIAGVSHPQDNYVGFGAPTTYLYTAWDGRFEDLGAVSSGNPVIDFNEYTSSPSAMSDYGEVVGGTTGQLVTKGASLWTRATGMVRVSDWLTGLGITTHQGWRLLETTFVSPDGKFIEGVGFKPQIGSGDVGGSWIVKLR